MAFSNVKRAECLWNGKIIGIETIYTINDDGAQINIPGKVEELRAKGRKDELFCPCGCGAILTLVAGYSMLKAQHFRLKVPGLWRECSYKTESRVSVNSKIILKCWLEDKLKTNDIENHVPIFAVDESKRKYEFSFLSRDKNLSLNYWYKSTDINDEKLDILESNTKGIHSIYILDADNIKDIVQYPEWIKKTQNKQEYCLFLRVDKKDEIDYFKAKLRASYYFKDIFGFWRAKILAEGFLSDFSINDDGKIVFEGTTINLLHTKWIEEYREYLEKQKEQQKKSTMQNSTKELNRNILSKKEQNLDVPINLVINKSIDVFDEHKEIGHIIYTSDSDFDQQEKQVWDKDGNRLVKCEFCGEVKKVEYFSITCKIGKTGDINIGTCSKCCNYNPAVMEKIRSMNNINVCPKCGGKLIEKYGQNGVYIGCNNYPKCNFTRSKFKQ